MDTPQPSTTRHGPEGLNPYLRLLDRLEQDERLDAVVDTVTPVAEVLVRDQRLHDVFDGTATGLPMHPILTDVPFGAWFMAQYLDLFDDDASRVAARRLVALGVVSAFPTAISGWARWATAPRATRRVGVVHAAANAVATVVFAASWVARSRGHDRRGAALARLGSVALVAGGFLGGHMGRHAPPPDAGTPR